MPRIKLQLSDGIKRVVTFDTDATVGATLGADVKLPSGAVATPSTFRAWLGVSTGSTSSSSTSFGPGNNGDVWRIVSGIPQWQAPAALTRANDTNVTLTLGGSPTTALLAATSLTLGWTGQLAEARGGTNQSTYAKGDLLYAGATNTLAKLAIGATGYVLTVDAAGVPVWAPSGASVTPSAMTRVNDTNVTLTLGGTPATSLLQAVSLTLGWTGFLAKARGGFGADASALSASITELNYTVGVTSAIQTQLNAKQALSSNLTAYAGGDTPSAFTLSIVDSADAAAWRAAIGAGTSSVTPAAMTKTDDTNVTLTLGGTPATSLLQATSLTLGWTGTLAKARGGFGLDASTLTGYVKAAGAGAMTASSTIPYSDISGAPSVPTLADGTYTPTLTSVSNINTLTGATWQYLRVGDTVTVSGSFTVSTTVSGSASFRATLPVASNFGSAGQAGGVALSRTVSNSAWAIAADATNDALEFSIPSGLTLSSVHYFSATYRVI